MIHNVKTIAQCNPLAEKQAETQDRLTDRDTKIEKQTETHR